MAVTDLVSIRPTLATRADLAAWLEEARALAILAAPLILTQLAQMATMTTDVILLGRFSRGALAAAAIGNTVYFLGWLIGGGPASAVTPIIAHILGQRKANRALVRAAVRMGLWSLILVSLPTTVMMWSAGPVLRALGQDPQVAADAGRFVAMLSFGLPFTLGMMALRNFATAVGHPRAGLWVVLATILFNALAGYALIFGHFGSPRLGIVGSGLATSASSIFGFLAMVVTIRLTPGLRVYRVFHRFTRPVLTKLTEVFRLGLPIGMTMIFEAMLFNTMTLVMGTFGTVSVAAHQIAMNVASITFMVPLGIGMAAVVRVGVAAGAEDYAAARRSGLAAMAVSIGFITLCAAAMFFAGAPIAGLYLGGAGDDGEVITMAVVFLKVAAAFQVFDALQVVAAQSLRGLKDARMPMVLAAGSYWLVGAPVCLFLGLTLHMRGFGIWIGLALGLAAAAVAMSLRFWRLTRASLGDGPG